MPQYIVETKQKIREVIAFLISRKREIRIQIEGETNLFTSRIIKVNYGDILSKIGKGYELIIENLVPDAGNTLIKSSSKIVIEFLLRGTPCQFDAKCFGKSTEYPHIGLIVSFPQALKIAERRVYDRDGKRIPDFVNAVFTVRNKEDRTYKLEIIDRSPDGVGMLITKKDFELLGILKEGDKLQGLELYASTAMIKVNGTVRHKTEIKDPKYKGSYALGIKLDATLEKLDSH
ncbi:MAG: flagellar brake protein [Desulfobacteraceae bacterium]|jgi:hypothetical protein